ncbi:MAG: SH3 domain-containing protein [Cyanobacteria bacterium RM1_2_2]|nr:SH3 domain-containing protein [Cyanobacteria bacterium RM1_2_2]
MRMSVPGVFKFILGFALAIALLFLTGAGLTRYLLSRLTTPPPRPTFTNDPSPSPVGSSAASPAASPPAAEIAPPTPAVVASPSPSPSPIGYRARVTQPIGLILRQEPTTEAARLGGIEFNEEVTVLEDSPDGGWQKVRAGSGAEGWVKGGNTARLD